MSLSCGTLVCSAPINIVEYLGPALFEVSGHRLLSFKVATLGCDPCADNWRRF